VRLSRGAKAVLAGITGLILFFIYAPLLLVVVNSFNADRTFGRDVINLLVILPIALRASSPASR
jgi:ABC-type spermidine/putrescine transport system permease subunit II